MPTREILVLAMTRMLSGVCTAGLVHQDHPASRLSWVRPIKERSSLLLGDLTDARGRVIQLGDVVEMQLSRRRSIPPHTEDWITDFIYHRPRLLRCLEGDRRARFLAEHLDRAAEEVLGQHPSRSLCLIRPDRLWAHFTLDPYSLKYEARIGFTQSDACHPQANSPRGLAVTDIKWRALGRSWLGEKGGELRMDKSALRRRLPAENVYLALGLSRGFQGKMWLMVIGVHVVPDYQVEIDYRNL